MSIVTDRQFGRINPVEAGNLSWPEVAASGPGDRADNGPWSLFLISEQRPMRGQQAPCKTVITSAAHLSCPIVFWCHPDDMTIKWMYGASSGSVCPAYKSQLWTSFPLIHCRIIVMHHFVVVRLLPLPSDYKLTGLPKLSLNRFFPCYVPVGAVVVSSNIASMLQCYKLFSTLL